MSLINISPLSLTNYGEYIVLNSIFRRVYEKENPPVLYAHLCDFSTMVNKSKPFNLENEKYRDLNTLKNKSLASEPAQEAYTPYKLELIEDNWEISLTGNAYKVTSIDIRFISRNEAWDKVTHVVLTEGINNIIAFAELSSPLTLSANSAYFLTLSCTYKDASNGLFSEGSRIALQSFFHSKDRYEHIQVLPGIDKKTFFVSLFDTLPVQTDKIGDLATEPDPVKDSPWYSRYELPLNSWDLIKEENTEYKIKKVISKPALFENRGSVSNTDLALFRQSVIRGLNKSWTPVSYAVLIFRDYTGIQYPFDFTILTGAPVTLAPGERIKIKYEFRQT